MRGSNCLCNYARLKEISECVIWEEFRINKVKFRNISKIPKIYILTVVVEFLDRDPVHLRPLKKIKFSRIKEKNDSSLSNHQPLQGI